MFALKRLMSAAVPLAVLVACKDSTSPLTVSPVVLNSTIASATSTFQNNLAFQSVAALSLQFPQYAGAALARSTLLRLDGISRPELQAALLRRTVGLAAELRNDPQALFPANVLGKTLEWDTQTNAYIIGTSTGAPSNGIRLLLYVANSSTGFPVLPLQQFGYLELTDESTPQSDKLGVRFTIAGQTIADYDLTVVTSTNTTTLRANGFIRNGAATEQVDFDLNDVVDLANGTLTSTNDLTANDGGAISVDMNIGQTSDHLVVRISNGGNSLELIADGDIINFAGPLTGTVSFNNVQVATLGGNVNSPAVTGVGGHTFTAAEAQALLSIFGAAIDIVFDVTGGIFAPGVIVFN